jgi:hypothetical protein
MSTADAEASPDVQSIRDRFIEARPRCPTCGASSLRKLAYFDPSAGDSGEWRRLSDDKPVDPYGGDVGHPDLQLKCLNDSRKHDWLITGWEFVPRALSHLYSARLAAEREAEDIAEAKRLIARYGPQLLPDCEAVVRAAEAAAEPINVNGSEPAKATGREIVRWTPRVEPDADAA